eukprot:7174329-Prymnesium_polylepis.1
MPGTTRSANMRATGSAPRPNGAGCSETFKRCSRSEGKVVPTRRSVPRPEGRSTRWWAGSATCRSSSRRASRTSPRASPS